MSGGEMGSGDAQATVRNWQSVRTVLEAVVVVLLGVLIRSMSVESSDRASQMATLTERLTSATTELSIVRAQLNDLPGMSRQIAKDEVRIDEHDRRILQLENAKRN